MPTFAFIDEAVKSFRIRPGSAPGLHRRTPARTSEGARRGGRNHQLALGAAAVVGGVPLLRKPGKVRGAANISNCNGAGEEHRKYIRFHSPSEADIRQWQSYVCSEKRGSLFTFIGAKRHKIKNDFQGMLMDYWIDEDDCQAVDCSDGSSAVFDAFLHSDFCLQPKGDGITRRSRGNGDIQVMRTRGRSYGEWKAVDPEGQPCNYSYYYMFGDKHKLVNSCYASPFVESLAFLDASTDFDDAPVQNLPSTDNDKK
nr:xyloglucan galactosyltransferase XLT2-like [Ipomoea trifida]